MKRGAIWALVVAVVISAAAMAQNAKPQGSAMQAPAQAAHSTEIQAAEKNAGAFVRLLDEGDYVGSYEQASSLFQSAVSKDDWVQRVGAVRKPLGKNLSHKVAGAKYSTTMPGAPDGHYVMMKLNSSFENKKDAEETLVMMLDKDNHWRVSGYFVK
jgi:Protein of unknown function (DUF4019)